MLPSSLLTPGVKLGKVLVYCAAVTAHPEPSQQEAQGRAWTLRSGPALRSRVSCLTY